MSVNTGEGVSVVDGADGGPPFLHRMNDPLGTGLRANVRFGNNGVAFATKTIPPADLGAPNVAAIAASELLVNYRSGFWRVHATLGGADNPYTFEVPLLALKL